MPGRQPEVPLVIEAVKQTRYKVARLYGRVTIADQEYFYVRTQDLLVRSDIFHAYQKEGFQRFLAANAGRTQWENLSSASSQNPASHHERD